jgi:hypothetical protein
MKSTNGMISGTKMLKCKEGQFNKAFLMTMDNGVEVIAKLPNPNTSPAFYTTTSEVTTWQFVSSTFQNQEILKY